MVAICSMVRKPVAFKTWLDYHISIGVEHFFLRIEETPELSELLNDYKSLVTVVYEDNIDKLNNLFSQKQSRQCDFCNFSIQKCLDMKIEWILHIDGDELICTENFDFLNKIKKDVDCIQIPNYEAVYPRDNLEDPFLETDRFKFDKETFNAYVHGKSIARVSKKLRSITSHLFSGKLLLYNDTELPWRKERYTAHHDVVILHFESSNFRSWCTKFMVENSKNTDEHYKFIIQNSITEMEKFYTKSIDITKEGDYKKCKDFYNQQKVLPYYEGLTKQLFWTPLQNKKNIYWKINYGKHTNLFN
jgi:hypothetical protein